MKVILILVIIALLGIGGYTAFNFYETKKDTKSNTSSVRMIEEKTKEEKVEPKIEEKEADGKSMISEEVVISKEHADIVVVKEDKKNKPVSQKSLIILDASGSMWSRVGKKRKIDIAKDVVKDIVGDTENFELGLMVYGHRNSKSCTDIETLIKPQKNNAKNISEVIDKISPKGMTPIGNSVLIAANSLEYEKQKASIILISDGVDTCGADLCEVGKKLHLTGVDFTAHVIGFDMTKEQEKGLECLANETGGVFASTQNANDLKEALKETIEEVESCTREQIGDVTLSIPSKNIETDMEFEIKWSGPSKSGDTVVILPKNSKSLESKINQAFSIISATKKGELMSPSNVGEYDIVYFAECGAILGRKSFVVKEATVSVNIPDIVETRSKIDITWTGPNEYGDDITILPKGSTHWDEHLDYISYLKSKKGKSKVLIPPREGEYDIVYWSNAERVLARKTFTVVSSENTTEARAHLMNVPATISKNAEFEVNWTGPKIDGNIITILPKGSENRNEYVGRSLYHIQKNDSSIKLISPSFPGEYDVVYWFKQERILDRKTFRVIE